MTTQSRPILIACGHGTVDHSARDAIHAVLASVRAALGVEVREAFVDVQEPRIAEVVASLASGAGVTAVVVPVLLATGYHVNHDIAKAVAWRDDVVATGPLGPDPRLVEIVIDRLAEAGVSLGASVVLASAGTSDERGQRETEEALDDLRAAWRGPVTLAFAAAGTPAVAAAVAEARTKGAETLAVASFLLAPGVFQRRLAEVGADVVTAALVPDPRIVAIIADRYHGAIAL